MHLAIFSAPARRLASCASDTGLGAGIRLWHFFIAALNAGAFTDTPFTVMLPLLFWSWMPPLPAVGSGKLGTPFLRMQAATASIVVCLALAAFVAVWEGLLEPPQAARAIAATIVTTVKEANLRMPTVVGKRGLQHGNSDRNRRVTAALHH
jgi:hypothetical protein